MQDLHGSEALTQLLVEERAVVVISPVWSTYAQKVELDVAAVEGELAGLPEFRSISFFSLRSDDPSENSEAWSWLKAHDGNPHSLYPMVGMGAGAILIVRRGKVVGFEGNGFAKGANEIRDFLLTRLEPGDSP